MDAEALKQEMDAAASEFEAAEKALREAQALWTHSDISEHPAMEPGLRAAELCHRDARDRHLAAAMAWTNRK